MNKNKSKIIGVVSTLIIAGLLFALSINHIRDNIWIIPITISALIGFLPPYIAGGKHPMPPRETYAHSFTTLGVATIMLLILNHTNMIVLLVFLKLPLVVGVVWIFSHLAFRINDKKIIKVKDFFR